MHAENNVLYITPVRADNKIHAVVVPADVELRDVLDGNLPAHLPYADIEFAKDAYEADLLFNYLASRTFNRLVYEFGFHTEPHMYDFGSPIPVREEGIDR